MPIPFQEWHDRRTLRRYIDIFPSLVSPDGQSEQHYCRPPLAYELIYGMQSYYSEYISIQISWS
jgi:hypothetical protein